MVKFTVEVPIIPAFQLFPTKRSEIIGRPLANGGEKLFVIQDIIRCFLLCPDEVYPRGQGSIWVYETKWVGWANHTFETRQTLGEENNILIAQCHYRMKYHNKRWWCYDDVKTVAVFNAWRKSFRAGLMPPLSDITIDFFKDIFVKSQISLKAERKLVSDDASVLQEGMEEYSALRNKIIREWTEIRGLSRDKLAYPSAEEVCARLRDRSSDSIQLDPALGYDRSAQVEAARKQKSLLKARRAARKARKSFEMRQQMQGFPGARRSNRLLLKKSGSGSGSRESSGGSVSGHARDGAPVNRQGKSKKSTNYTHRRGNETGTTAAQKERMGDSQDMERWFSCRPSPTRNHPNRANAAKKLMEDRSGASDPEGLHLQLDLSDSDMSNDTTLQAQDSIGDLDENRPSSSISNAY